MANFWFCGVIVLLGSLSHPAFACPLLAVESTVFKVDPIAPRTTEGLNNYLLTLGKYNASWQRPFVGCLFSVHTLKILFGVYSVYKTLY